MSSKRAISSFISALKTCKDVDTGRSIHASCIQAGFHTNVFLATSLIKMYAKCRHMSEARSLFNTLRHPDVFSWTAILLGYAENGEGHEALHLFRQMQNHGFVPDTRSFLGAIMACSSLAENESGEKLNGKVVKLKSLEKGMNIHSQAAAQGYMSDIFIGNSLVDMYAKCGSMSDASMVFSKMPILDVVSWNVLMLGYVLNGESETALAVYKHMRNSNCTVNGQTFVAALKSCATLGALETGEAIRGELRLAELNRDPHVRASLVDFYAKCGRMDSARELFNETPCRDLAFWTSLIYGYARQGDSNEVMLLFERMVREQVPLDGVIFLAVLTACNHAGLCEQARELLQSMLTRYRVRPTIEHYHCVVDMLGRLNQVEEAMEVVGAMPFQPNAVTWRIVLSACRRWRNSEVGKVAFESLVRLDDRQSAAYLLMADIYASLEMWEEEAHVLRMKSEAGALKPPGHSWWTDGDGNVHRFMIGDTNHPQGDVIRSKLRELLTRMKTEEGYIANVGSVLHNISQVSKEDALCEHSERLAISCAIVNTEPGKSIRVATNLRMCEDCHKVVSIISKMERREIVCRDSSRFHTFKLGKCSCRDFW